MIIVKVQFARVSGLQKIPPNLDWYIRASVIASNHFGYHCIDSGKGINDKDPKFKIGDIVRISKYKNNFAKGYSPNWSEEVLMMKKVKILCRGHILLMTLTEKKLLELFTKKNCKKKIKKSLELKTQSREKMINNMLNQKDPIIHLIAGWIKKDIA